MNKILYISGWGRSGSTLLGSLLDQIKDVHYIGEGYYFWERGVIEDRLCSCGRKFSQCAYWQDIVEGVGGNIQRIASDMVDWRNTLIRTRYLPLLSQQIMRGVHNHQILLLERLYKRIQDRTNPQLVVDASKFPAYGFILRELSDVEVYVLHLVRDARAVAYSWSQEKQQPSIFQRKYMKQFNSFQSAMYWNSLNLSSSMYLKNNSFDYITLRYEDFVQEPNHYIKKIMRFVGLLDVIAPNFDEVIELRVNHSISGNPDRFKERIKVRADIRWISEMSYRSKFVVTLLTLPLLIRYGYKPWGSS